VARPGEADAAAAPESVGLPPTPNAPRLEQDVTGAPVSPGETGGEHADRGVSPYTNPAQAGRTLR